jgi:hypothetical protein
LFTIKLLLELEGIKFMLDKRVDSALYLLNVRVILVID